MFHPGVPQLAICAALGCGLYLGLLRVFRDPNLSGLLQVLYRPA